MKIEGGSSPHTRGARVLECRFHGADRIIPAYAGSTPVGRVAEMREAGSSPHTRGAQPLFLAKRRDHRIIPAYAGSTDPARQAAPGRQDHPRIRGEHPIAAKPDNLVMGSSPHTRGALPHLRLHVRHHRIIPAYAGSTSAGHGKASRWWDHPRIRGEHLHVLLNARMDAGSSPHTRGALSGRVRGRFPGRIIPAYAGSTSILRRRNSTHRDHPRIRGEHFQGRELRLRSEGSSPHTRGAPRFRSPGRR